MRLWPTLDALTPLLVIFAIALGFAHLASGDAFGAATRMPWGIYLWGTVRQPTQIYEILAAGVIAIFIWTRLRKIDAVAQPDGKLFLTFLALSAVARIVIDSFRGDSVTILGGLRLAQLIAWLVLAGSLWALGWKLRSERNISANQENQS